MKRSDCRWQREITEGWEIRKHIFSIPNSVIQKVLHELWGQARPVQSLYKCLSTANDHQCSLVEEQIRVFDIWFIT